MMETNYRLQPAFPLEPGVAHRLDGASLLLLRGKASDEWTREAGKVPRGQDDGGAATVDGLTDHLAFAAPHRRQRCEHSGLNACALFQPAAEGSVDRSERRIG